MDDAAVRVKERLDLADIIGEYVALKRVGGHFKGLCPFHQEKTPSFVVSPDKGIWHCFGCFPPGEKIKTPFGYHDIEALDKDHYVVSDTGEIRRILATHQRQYRGDLITIRLRKLSYPVRLTADHTVFAIRGTLSTRKHYKTFAKRYRRYLKYLQEKRGGRFSYEYRVNKYFPIQKIAAGELEYGDLLLYPIDDLIENFEVINLEDYLDHVSRLGPRPPQLQLEQLISPELLKLFGYYIAEGSNHRAYIRFSLGNHEEDFAQEIVTLIDTLFGLKASIHRRPGARTGIEVTACHAHLATIFSNLLGKGAANKHIPFIFQRLPYEKQKILLDAVHRGDGTSFVMGKSAKKHKSITTISRVLVEQLTDILLRGNMFPTVRVQAARQDRKEVNHREAFTVQWSEEAESRYNLVYHSGGKRYWILPIYSLRREKYEGPVHNLTVDHDHSYVATSFAVANCGTGGDHFSFIQQIEGIDFLAALHLLAERAGVTVERHRGADAGQAKSRRQRLFELLDYTARFYHEILRNQPAGAQARAYLAERGVLPETLQRFQLGYAPQRWDTLQAYLRHKGFTPAEMVAAGVAGESKRGTLFDRFRGRIIFPVTDVQGRAVALGGRIAPWHATGDEGKYINSPETDLYSKRRIIYNLQRAKQYLRHETPAVVMEGYMDVVLADQSGVHNAVASAGTAFTSEHIQMLARYTRELHFAFDADAAGFAAIVTASRAALQAGFRVATIVLPPGSDPADVARASAAQLQELVAHPQALMAVLLTRLQAGRGTVREESLRDLAPLLAQVENPVVQGEMVQDVAAALHVPEQRIFTLLAAARPAAELAMPAAEEPAGQELLSTEHYFMGLLLAYPEVRAAFLGDTAAELMLDEKTTLLYNEVHGMAEREAATLSLSADDLIARLPTELASFGQAICQLSQERVEQSRRMAADEARVALSVVRRRSVARRLASVQSQLAESNAAGRAALLRQFHQLTEELAHHARP